MMDIAIVQTIHQLLVQEFGGAATIRSSELLASALARPHATFDGQDLYPTATAKAATLLESILVNHPFADGNKRTGYTLMRLCLLANGLDIFATDAQKYAFIISVAAGQVGIEQIISWLKQHTVVR